MSNPWFKSSVESTGELIRNDSTENFDIIIFVSWFSINKWETKKDKTGATVEFLPDKTTQDHYVGEKKALELLTIVLIRRYF